MAERQPKIFYRQAVGSTSSTSTPSLKKVPTKPSKKQGEETVSCKSENE